MKSRLSASKTLGATTIESLCGWNTPAQPQGASGTLLHPLPESPTQGGLGPVTRSQVGAEEKVLEPSSPGHQLTASA